MSTAAPLRPAVRPAAPPSPFLSRRSDLITIGLGTWLMVGLFVDGWAHSNLTELETFLTPWHGLFYSGFMATAGWIGLVLSNRQRAGLAGRLAIPVGYGTALVGIVIFLLGGIGDLAWHSVFGIEQDLDALFSPTHLLLGVGIVAILVSPLRAALRRDHVGTAPTLRSFLPVVMSATLVTALFSFMLMWIVPATDQALGIDLSTLAMPAADVIGDVSRSSSLAGLLLTTVLMISPLLVLLRHWRTPVGTATLLFTVVTALTSAIVEFDHPSRILAAAAAGLLVDLLIRALDAGPGRTDRVRLVGLAAPVLLWGLTLAGVASEVGISWSVEVTSGIVLWSGLIGLAQAWLMVPAGPAVVGVDTVQ